MAQKKKKKKKAAAEKKADTAIEACPIKNDAAPEYDEYAEAEYKAMAARDELDEKELAELISAPEVDIPHSDNFSEEDFVSSLKEFKAEDITPAEVNHIKRKKKKLSLLANITQLIIFTLCASVVILCAVTLTKSIRDKIVGENIYSNTDFDRFTLTNESRFNHPSGLTMLKGDAEMLSLYDRIAQGKSDSSSSNNQYSKKLDAMRASLTALKAQNSDVYGWIYVENTVIDHPIMRGEDNDYYLDHAYTGESLPIGSIFADSTTADKLTYNYNTVIYGHNVVDVAGSKSSMFHDVTKFFDEEFFNSNKIYVYTMDGVFIFKPISVYSTTYDSEYYRFIFNSEDDFIKYANGVVGASQIPSGEKFENGDKMISLYTCTNGVNNFRYALHGKLIEAIQ